MTERVPGTIKFLKTAVYKKFMVPGTKKTALTGGLFLGMRAMGAL